VHLKVPLAAGTLRAQFGNQILSRDRQDGGNEEIYYPSLKALILYDDPSHAAAISFLSQRYVADIHMEKFNELHMKGAKALAKVEADKAVLIAPDYARGYLGFGLYYEEMKNFDAAMEHYRRATNAVDGIASKARALAFIGDFLWANKDENGAEASYRQAWQTWSLEPYVNQRYGYFLWLKGRDKEAIPILHQAFDLDTDYAKNWSKRAYDLYRNKNDQQAVRDYSVLANWLETKAGAQMMGDQFKGEVYRRYGHSLYLLKRDQEALEQYNKAEQFLPGDFIIEYGLARVLLELDRYKEALSYAEKAQGIKPANAWLMVVRARIHAAMGSKGQALDWLSKALAAGYKNKGFLQKNRHLASIRDTRKFKRLIKDM
jgi:tetratricopeptide (TPR) repeat protein